MKISKGITILIVGLLCLLLPGCGGSSSVPVTGMVTLDGQPVTGHLVFVPADSSRPKRGGPIEDGRYDIPTERGPIPGKHRVEIYARKKTGRRIQGTDAEQSTDETVESIPAKFNVESTLTSDVKRGLNQLDFSLSSK